MRTILRAGAVAGLIAGVGLALFLRLVGAGPMGDAIALEPVGGTEELLSRRVQQAGGVAGAMLYGLGLGTAAGVVLAAVRHRLGAADDWRRALALAAAAFVTVSLVPFLKYPANPPGVGDPSTVGRRTALYLLVLAWSGTATWGAWRLSRWLRRRGWPDHLRLPAAVAAHASVVAAALVLLPGSPDVVAAPATLVWRFRLASLGGAAVFWALYGSVLGWLLLRAAPTPVRREGATAG